MHRRSVVSLVRSEKIEEFLPKILVYRRNARSEKAVAGSRCVKNKLFWPLEDRKVRCGIQENSPYRAANFAKSSVINKHAQGDQRQLIRGYSSKPSNFKICVELSRVTAPTLKESMCRDNQHQNSNE